MSSTQEQGLAAVPPQGRPADAVAAPKGDEAAVEATGVAAVAEPTAMAESAENENSAAASAPAAEAARFRSHQAGARQTGEPRRRPAPPQNSQKAGKQSRAEVPAYDPEPDRMPLMARVLLGDLAVAVVGLVVLFVIEVQRFGDASLGLRRRAWHEDLIVLFVVTGIFAVITFLLARARHKRVFIVQVIVTALVLAAAVTSAATGDPKPSPTDPATTSTPGHPG